MCRTWVCGLETDSALQKEVNLTLNDFTASDQFNQYGYCGRFFPPGAVASTGRNSTGGGVGAGSHKAMSSTRGRQELARSRLLRLECAIHDCREKSSSVSHYCSSGWFLLGKQVLSPARRGILPRAGGCSAYMSGGLLSRRAVSFSFSLRGILPAGR